MQKFIGVALPVVLLSGIAQHASATTGYFMHGYGVKAQGQAGASIAAFNASKLVWSDIPLIAKSILFIS